MPPILITEWCRKVSAEVASLVTPIAQPDVEVFLALLKIAGIGAILTGIGFAWWPGTLICGGLVAVILSQAVSRR